MILLAVLPFAALAWWSAPVALGATLALLPAYLVKATVLGVPVTLLECALLGTVLGAFLRALLARTRPVGFGPLTLPVLALVVVWLASALLSADPRAGLGAFKAWLLEPILLSLVAVDVLRTEHARWVAVGGLIAGAVGLSLYGIVEKVFGFGLPPDGRLNSVFVPANYHAMFVAPVLALCLGLLRGAAGRPRRFILLTLAALAIGASLILTQSYGGYLGVGGAGAVLVATLPRRTRTLAALALLAVALFTVLPQIGSEKFQLLGKLNERSSSSVRVQIWHTAVNLTAQHPLLGVGPNAFEAPYREEVARLYWPPLEWLVAQPHSLYLALAAETGLLGLGSFLWLLVAWARAALRPVRLLGERPWALASALALITILVHGIVDTPVLKNDLAVLFAFTLALPFLPPPESESRRA